MFTNQRRCRGSPYLSRIDPAGILENVPRHPEGPSADQLRAQGIEAFRAKVLAHEPFLGERVAEIASWDDIKLLVVQVNRLRRWWKPGLLCIGDAAHAMSPIGGVGINLAVQDGVAAANLLARPLKERRVGVKDLAASKTARLGGSDHPTAPNHDAEHRHRTRT